MQIIKWTTEAVKTLDFRNMDTEGSSVALGSFPFTRVSTPLKSGQRDHISAEDLCDYVGILIRNTDYNSMDDAIVERIVQKNREHNVKSANTLLLLDKQGAFHMSAEGQPNDFFPQKHSRASDLVELALVAKQFIREYRRLRVLTEDLADFFIHKIMEWVKRPEAVFSESVTNNGRTREAAPHVRKRPRRCSKTSRKTRKRRY